jgi:hypothetical protein
MPAAAAAPTSAAAAAATAAAVVDDVVPPSGRLSVPLSEYQVAISTMIQQAKDAGVPHILVMTPPPVDEATHSSRASHTMASSTSSSTSKCGSSSSTKQQGQWLAMRSRPVMKVALQPDQSSDDWP